MATARPFAYNTGSPIAGTDQVGNLAIGTPTIGFDATGLEWWNGPDEDLGYVIAESVPLDTQPTPVIGVSGSVGFFRSDTLTEGSFIGLADIIAGPSGGGPFASGSDAKTWLNNNGYWTSYTGISINLIMNLNSTLGISGSSWTDQSAYSNNATLYGGYGTTTYNGSQVVTFNGSSAYVFPTGGFGLNLDTGLTYEVWAYPTTTSNGTLLAEWQGSPPTGWNDTQMAFVSGTINAGLYPNAFSPLPYLIGPSFTANTWYNIVMTYDDTTGDLKLYINGSLINTTNGTKANPPATYLTLGRPDSANSYIGGADGYFQGYIGSWKIWDGPISGASVLANFNASKSRFGL